MVENVLIGVMCVICIAVGVFIWWMENGHSSDDGNADASVDDITKKD